MGELIKCIVLNCIVQAVVIRGRSVISLAFLEGSFSSLLPIPLLPLLP